MTNTLNALWTLITEYGIATNEEIDLVTSINGISEDTLNDIIYARTGYHDIQQFEEAEVEEEDYEEPDDLEMGFDPYEGGYTYDC